jgi:uncharacterized protein YqgV (UPF0045/DUF77 family)
MQQKGTQKASLKQYIDLCCRLFDKHQIRYSVHATGTTLGGEWMNLSQVIEECIQGKLSRIYEALFGELKLHENSLPFRGSS